MATEVKDLEIIKEQVDYAVNWCLGGYENAIQDGYMEHHLMPSCLELVEEIYSNLQYSSYYLGAEANGPVREIKECDPVFLKGVIAHRIMEYRCTC